MGDKKDTPEENKPLKRNGATRRKNRQEPFYAIAPTGDPQDENPYATIEEARGEVTGPENTSFYATPLGDGAKPEVLYDTVDAAATPGGNRDTHDKEPSFYALPPAGGEGPVYTQVIRPPKGEQNPYATPPAYDIHQGSIYETTLDALRPKSPGYSPDYDELETNFYGTRINNPGTIETEDDGIYAEPSYDGPRGTTTNKIYGDGPEVSGANTPPPEPESFYSHLRGTRDTHDSGPIYEDPHNIYDHLQKPIPGEATVKEKRPPIPIPGAPPTPPASPMSSRPGQESRQQPQALDTQHTLRESGAAQDLGTHDTRGTGSPEQDNPGHGR